MIDSVVVDGSGIDDGHDDALFPVFPAFLLMLMVDAGTVVCRSC